MKYSVEVSARVVVVEVADDGVTLDGQRIEARLLGEPGSVQRRLSRLRGSRAFTAVRGEERGAWTLSFDGARIEALVLDERSRMVRAAAGPGAAGAGSGTLRAPMPGLVVRVLVAEGQEVVAGQSLVVVEAMKMENELKAPRAGTVQRIHVEPGAKVEKGAVLLEVME